MLSQSKKRKRPTETKEKEKKQKISEELQQPLTQKDFIKQIVYKNKKPLYFKDIDVNNEKSEKKLTDQVKVLIQQIKIEYHKAEILGKVADKKELTAEQKAFIYLDIETLEKSEDPVKKFFAHNLKEIPEDDWDKVTDLYFTSFSSKSYFADTKSSPIRQAERPLLFSQGKKYLETLLYKIRNLDVSELLVKQALDELYTKIGVCPGGIMNDLQNALSYLADNLETMIATQLTKLCNQAAADFTNTIILRGFDREIDIDENIKEITNENFNDISHAVAELKDYISLNTHFKLGESFDLTAHGFFSQKEKEEFKAQFTNPQYIQSTMIEGLYVSYETQLHEVTNMEESEKFFEKLALLGKLTEKSDVYFEIKDGEFVKIKDRTEVAQKLRASIMRRVMESGCLGELITPRKLLPLGPENCDIVLTPRFINQEASQEQKQFYTQSIAESKTPYSYILHDRNFGCVIWNGAPPTPETAEHFFMNGNQFVYAILVKEKKNELYFLEKNPLSIRQVVVRNPLLLRKAFSNHKKEVGPTPVVIEADLEKIKSLDSTFRHEKTVCFLQKEPFAIQLLTKDSEKFTQILKELKLDSSSFSDARIIKESKHLSEVERITEHSSRDILYLNLVCPELSFVKENILRSEASLISLKEYIQKSSIENQTKLLIAFYDQIKNMSVFFTHYSSCLHVQAIKSFLQESQFENLSELLGKLIEVNQFDAFRKLFAAEKALFAGKNRSEDYVSMFLLPKLKECIDNEDNEKIRELCWIDARMTILMLSSTHTLNMLPLYYALEKGLLPQANILINFYTHSPLKELIDEKSFNSHCERGLNYLIYQERFESAKIMYSADPQKYPHAKEKVIEKIFDLIDEKQSDKITLWLDFCQWTQGEVNCIMHYSARSCDSTTLRWCLIAGGDTSSLNGDNKDLFHSIGHGIFELIQQNRFKEVSDFLDDHKLNLQTSIFTIGEMPQTLKYLKDGINFLAKDSRPEGVQQLERLLNLIDRFLNASAIVDDFICSPINLAATIGNLAAIRLLEKYGVTDQNLFELSLVEGVKHLALTGDNDKLDEFIKSYPSVADNKESIIHFAIELNHIEMIESIARYNVKALDCINADSISGLQFAINKNASAIACVLIESHVSLCYQDSKGSTALHYAVTNNNFAVTKMLIDAQCYDSFAMRDGNDHTAYECAASNPNLQAYMVIQILKNYLEVNEHRSELSSIAQSHLQHIHTLESESNDEEKVDWNTALQTIVTMSNDFGRTFVMSPLMRYTFLTGPTKNADIQDYLSIFTESTCSVIYEKLVSRIQLPALEVPSGEMVPKK